MLEDVRQLDKQAAAQLKLNLGREIDQSELSRICGSPDRLKSYELLVRAYSRRIGAYLPGNLELVHIARANHLNTARQKPVHIPTLEFYLRLRPRFRPPFSRAMNFLGLMTSVHAEILSDVDSLRTSGERLDPVKEGLLNWRDRWVWDFLKIAVSQD